MMFNQKVLHVTNQNIGVDKYDEGCSFCFRRSAVRNFIQQLTDLVDLALDVE